MSVGNYPQCPLCPKESRPNPKRMEMHMRRVHGIITSPTGNPPYFTKSQRGREWKESQRKIKPKIYSGQFESNRQLH